MGTVSKAEILKLSISERILLVEDIWDSIAEAPEEISLTKAQEQELDNRLEAHHKNPTEGSPWAMVRDRVRAGNAT